MTAYRICFFTSLLLAPGAFAQTAPWTGPLRGSWVQTGAPAQGDVTLAATDRTADIVVADDENSAVHQAAEFLAGDIEKISGHRPSIVDSAGGGRPAIHLVTLGHGTIPAAMNAGAMQGQWESYRIVDRRRRRVAGRAPTRAALRSPPTRCPNGWASIRFISGPATGRSITIPW